MGKVKNKRIVIPVFNSEYKVIVVWGNEKLLQKTAKDYQYPDDIPYTLDTSNRGCCFNRHECHPIIYLPKRPQTSEEIGTLAHEAVHAVNHIFDKISEPIRDTEVFAHSVGAVVRKVLYESYN